MDNSSRGMASGDPNQHYSITTEEEESERVAHQAGNMSNDGDMPCTHHEEEENYITRTAIVSLHDQLASISSQRDSPSNDDSEIPVSVPGNRDSMEIPVSVLVYRDSMEIPVPVPACRDSMEIPILNPSAEANDDEHDYMNDPSTDEHDYINDKALNADYINDEVVAANKGKGPDYINQSVVDEVQTGSPGAAAMSTGATPHPPPTSSSSGQVHSRNGAQRQPVAAGADSHRGDIEKRLLAAAKKSKCQMPDMEEISWYHPGISRHVAESLLLSKDGLDGTYLLRDSASEPNTVTLSVRYHNSVKHYKVCWDGKEFLFGLGKFSTLEEFKEHFSHQPIISGESGSLVQLRYPYPRAVSEPALYHDAVEISNLSLAEAESLMSMKQASKAVKASKTSNNDLDLSINSKEGYLTKLGFHRKNWKKRWFVLYKNELKYFNNGADKEPLRVINLEDVSRVDRDDTAGKQNCFRVVTPNRTFFMYATSEVEANEWVQILDWRLKQQSK